VSVIAAALALVVTSCQRQADLGPATLVDEGACAACHAEETRRWRGSHHNRAMQVADDSTVLGDFDGTTFRAHGMTTRFWRRAGRFIVTTDGPDGRPADFEVRYTFGVAPLQQYLVALPGGRWQALSVAWDTARKRWFHLYPNERIDHTDELHWTKPSQNWNFMCAECHSTGVQKNYDPATDRYDTRWFQIDVGCQACHGPGSAHQAWARTRARGRAAGAAAMGLATDLRATNGTAQLEACGRCHARRSAITAEYVYGRPLMDTHLPALLEEGLYHADGQIRDEDYEYGSFLQSRMNAKGVRCTDCHDPHSGGLRAEGNALCVRCHNVQTPKVRAGIDVSELQSKGYDSHDHTFHVPGTPGSRCLECHAPRTTYMVVDPRIDHSFRIPRPDLSVRFGTPNACNGCHRDRTPQWAAGEIARRHPGYRPRPHYGEALDAGRRGAPGAVAALIELIRDRTSPAIVRATAIELLARFPGALSGALTADVIRDPDPLVRRAVVEALESVPDSERRPWLTSVLRDPVRAVRIEAARVLAGTPDWVPPDSVRPAFEDASAELETSLRANQDRVEGRCALAHLWWVRGRAAAAESTYRSALAFEPLPVLAVVNGADFYRATGREADAEALLRRGLAAHPGDPSTTQALALSLVRQGRKPEALGLLGSAAPGQRELRYLYALSLEDAGRHSEALRVLEQALSSASGDRDILLTLASLHAQAGDRDRAVLYLRRLAAINPYDPALGSFVR